jgi:hypothetical protein
MAEVVNQNLQTLLQERGRLDSLPIGFSRIANDYVQDVRYSIIQR